MKYIHFLLQVLRTFKEALRAWRHEGSHLYRNRDSASSSGGQEKENLPETREKAPCRGKGASGDVAFQFAESTVY